VERKSLLLWKTIPLDPPIKPEDDILWAPKDDIIKEMSEGDKVRRFFANAQNDKIELAIKKYIRYNKDAPRGCGFERPKKNRTKGVPPFSLYSLDIGNIFFIY